MIKLIASDVDGTLLEEGTSNIDPEIFELIRGLQKKGVHFAAASGRSYDSIRALFAPVADDIFYLAENGAYVVEREKPLLMKGLDDEVMSDLIDYARSISDRLRFFMVAGFDQLYTESADEEFIRNQEKGYNVCYQRLDDLHTITAPLIKCALYSEEDAAVLAEEVKRIFGDRALIAPSGAHWIDCIPKDVDKGRALHFLQEKLGVSPDETMVFGDNTNDIPMLQAATESYVVEEGRIEAKAAARYSAGRMREGGVLKVLRELLASL